MLVKNYLLAILASIAFFMGQSSFAQEAFPPTLINFSSQASLNLLKKDLNINLLKLLSHFTTQKTLKHCGIASAVTVLNATEVIPPIDNDHFAYQYFTQDNFFNEKVLQIVKPEEVAKEGISLLKLSQAMATYGVKVNIFYGNDLSLDKFREVLQTALLNQQFIIVNYNRMALDEKGGGHHSPIGAYDNATDRFLILDVARYKYAAAWVKTEVLWNAVRTFDHNTSRGFLIINA